jgi:hypothetical protein
MIAGVRGGDQNDQPRPVESFPPAVHRCVGLRSTAVALLDLVHLRQYSRLLILRQNLRFALVSQRESRTHFASLDVIEAWP